MNKLPLPITKIIRDQFFSFQIFCRKYGIEYAGELTNLSFLAFSTLNNCSEEYINLIKRLIIANTNISTFNEKRTLFNNTEVFSLKTEHCLEYSTVKLAYLFKVISADYSEISILRLNIKESYLQGLIDANCFTLQNLFRMTFAEVLQIPGISIDGADSIIQGINGYLLFNYERDRLFMSVLLDTIKNPKNSGIKRTNRFSVSNLRTLYQDALEVLGEDLCSEALYNPSYISIISETLQSVSQITLKDEIKTFNEEKRAEELDENENINVQYGKNAISLSDPLPKRIREQKAFPFIRAYNFERKHKIDWTLYFSDKETSIEDLQNQITDKYVSNEARLISYIRDFFEWLRFDFHEIVQKQFEFISRSKGNTAFVLKERAKGNTLQSIGTQLKLSRERIRQIETQAIRKFWSNRNNRKYDLILLVSALDNGNCCIDKDCLDYYLNEYSDYLWLIVENSKDNQVYFYSRTLDAIVILPEESKCRNESELRSLLFSFLYSFPKIMTLDEADKKYCELSESTGLPKRIIEAFFDSYYHYTRLSIVVKNDVTISEICTYVLEERFKNSLDHNNQAELNRFVLDVQDLCEEKTSSKKIVSILKSFSNNQNHVVPNNSDRNQTIPAIIIENNTKPIQATPPVEKENNTKQNHTFPPATVKRDSKSNQSISLGVSEKYANSKIPHKWRVIDMINQYVMESKHSPIYLKEILQRFRSELKRVNVNDKKSLWTYLRINSYDFKYRVDSERVYK